jgi:hypothetical protein
MPASLTFPHPAMTAEKPTPRDESPEHRQYVREEIEREMQKLWEKQERWYAMVENIRTEVSKTEVDLPHWRTHEQQINYQFEMLLKVLYQSPRTNRFYPPGAMDKLIDDWIKRGV